MKSFHKRILFAIWVCLIFSCSAFAPDAAYAEDSPKTASNTPPDVDKLIQLQRKGCALYYKLGDVSFYLPTYIVKDYVGELDADKKWPRRRCYTDLNPHPTEMAQVTFFPMNSFPEYKQSLLPKRSKRILKVEVSAFRGDEYFRDSFETYYKSRHDYKKDFPLSSLPIEGDFNVLKTSKSIGLYFAVDPDRKTSKGNPITFYCWRHKTSCKTSYLYQGTVFEVQINNTELIPQDKWLHFYDLFVSYIHSIIIDENAPLAPQMLRIEDMQNLP